MPMSNFPNGFINGVTIRNVPILQTNPGKVIWVNNSSVLPEGGIGGSNTNDGTYLRPKSTIEGALDAVTASRGDIIALMPGHAESVTSAGAITIDKAGVALIGLGHGALRPTLTVSTASTANIQITAANTILHNLLILGNKNDLANCVLNAADGTLFSEVEIRESTNGMLNGLTIGSADGDSDYVTLYKCKFRMDEPGVTNVGDSAISIAKDSDHILIEECEIYGDFDNAGIDVPAGGNACDFLTIRKNYIENTATGQHAIQINTGGTMNGGLIADNLLVSDSYSTLLEPHTLTLANNKASLGGTLSAAVDFPLRGSGAGNSTITKVTTSSMASGFGVCDDPAIFTVTGDVMCRCWGIVKTAITSTCATGTLSLGVADNNTLFIPAITMDGTNGAQNDVLANATTTVNGDNLETGSEWAIISNGVDIQAFIATNAMTAGVVDFYCEWIPLSTDGNVA